MRALDMPTLTVLICTHDRLPLLERAVASLDAAERPPGWTVRLFVVANACSDATPAWLDERARLAGSAHLPLAWIAEPTPGKSHALNAAIPQVADSDLVAFVDDDHRVDSRYLVALAQGAEMHPEMSMFCGRILPDWDGTEPAWVHDDGPYRIRPRPVPYSDMGEEAREIPPGVRAAGGGNLAVRGGVLRRVGKFDTRLGPHGHDLGGGEDVAFVARAQSLGERLFYLPEVKQYHHVDRSRLELRYVLRKAYARARSDALHTAGRGGIPPYQWHKLATYLLALLTAFTPARARFYLVRLATTLGEMAGQGARRWRGAVRAAERRRNRRYAGAAMVTAIAAFAGILALPGGPTVLAAALTAAALGTALAAVRSLLDYSRTGPRLPAEVIARFRADAIVALSRLLAHAFFLLLVLAGPGLLVYGAAAYLGAWSASFWGALLAALLSIAAAVGLQFLRHLVWLPANIAASYAYRLSRLYRLWKGLSPGRLRVLTTLLVAPPLVGSLGALAMALARGDGAGVLAFGGTLLLYWLAAAWLAPVEARPVRAKCAQQSPNLLLIGSDTLRWDRVLSSRPAELAPTLTRLVAEGTALTNCYVPIARTAPSLMAMLTGCWPQRLGIHDNFVPDEVTHLAVDTLPRVLARHGWHTLALSDWCGADLGKFDLGFAHADVPEDQWNIRLFLRQGPKDLRLFLSLFARNRYGRYFLPEIYYLGGVPQTDALGREARHLLSELAARGQPFLLDVFFSTTHGPFGSEYPWYTRYADPAYEGESKFVMARLTDPWEIIARQAEPREAFDLDQILALYDGCVARFDHEVGRILAHLESCGLAENTLVVLYSDHGMEFFEHGSWGQGNSVVSEASNRIPVVLRGPGVSRGVRIDTPLSSIDIAPTLLEAVGLTPPEAWDGRSIWPWLRGEADNDPRDVFFETGIWLTPPPGMPPEHRRCPPLSDILTVRNPATGTLSLAPEWEGEVYAAKDRALRRGRWKLVCQPLTHGHLLKLFDLETDPACQVDVASAYPQTVRELWLRLQPLIGHEIGRCYEAPAPTATHLSVRISP